MSKILTTLILLLAIKFSYAQNQTISVIDFVKIKNDKRAEALYFYENNWKVYRDSALKSEFISSYRLLTTTPDSSANFDLILITEYADSSNFKLREERFQKIIKVFRPNGPVLLNNVKPNDFRQILFTKEAGTWLYAQQKQSKTMGTK